VASMGMSCVSVLRMDEVGETTKPVMESITGPMLDHYDHKEFACAAISRRSHQA
jgi:anti-sigma factor RsiW